MNPGEAQALAALAATVAPRVVVEFGVNEGLTARMLLRAFPSIVDYRGVDVLPGYVTACAVQRREVPAQPGRFAQSDQRFRLVLKRRGTFDLRADDLPFADMVFIDGDHGRAAVKHDTALARDIVRPGGLIVWHDYHHAGTVDVADVLEEMAAGGAPIHHIAGTWLAFERV